MKGSWAKPSPSPITIEAQLCLSLVFLFVGHALILRPASRTAEEEDKGRKGVWNFLGFSLGSAGPSEAAEFAHWLSSLVGWQWWQQ